MSFVKEKYTFEINKKKLLSLLITVSGRTSDAYFQIYDNENGVYEVYWRLEPDDNTFYKILDEFGKFYPNNKLTFSQLADTIFQI